MLPRVGVYFHLTNRTQTYLNSMNGGERMDKKNVCRFQPKRWRKTRNDKCCNRLHLSPVGKLLYVRKRCAVRHIYNGTRVSCAPFVSSQCYFSRCKCSNGQATITSLIRWMRVRCARSLQPKRNTISFFILPSKRLRSRTIPLKHEFPRFFFFALTTNAENMRHSNNNIFFSAFCIHIT